MKDMKLRKPANGREALDLFKTETDFVCLDITMPELNGSEVCREIRKSDQDIPIIFEC